MKNILVTGGTGFIGSHLVEMCVKKNFKVTCFDRYNPNYNLNNLENSKYLKKINFIFGDIRDYDSVSKAVKGQDYVFHLAALGGIPYSYTSPLAYIKTNVEGTYNVLQASKLNLVKQVIVTSTSEVYGSAQTIPIDESHPLVGQSPYAASKIAADQLAISYWKSFGYKVKIIRPFNVYGPRQSLRAIIPTIISQFLNNQKKIKLGNIYTSRDFTYVDDLCSAYFHLLKEKKIFGQPVNIGTSLEYKIKDVLNVVKDLTRKNLKISSENLRKRPINSEVNRLVCDFSKFRNLTNWSPKISFKSGVARTLKWFKDNRPKHTKDYHI